MFEYELHKVMHAELIRRAGLQRLAREAYRARRARRNLPEESGRTVSTSGVRDRFTPAA
ncbi:hypothetical protein [Streptomyces sp. 130]|uniref:hypothetical protein n=1 Tax=Streptomyces sp. 130 TaxID=2591006 RepID=UPI00163DDF4A|nr:hypothetical protein [Streptomyces sp. 130]